jgi:nucleoid-associated protein YgaU
MVNLDQAKAKYQSVIDMIKAKGGSLKNVHIEGEKLLIRASMATENLKNDVWNEIKRIDAGFADLMAEISVDSTLKPPARTYTVKAGDSLSKIAKEFYGDPMAYKKIVEANPSIKNPDLIHAGDVFVIPD